MLRAYRHALRWMSHAAGGTGRVFWWQIEILDRSFEIVHRAGMTQPADDVLPRLPNAIVESTELEGEIPVMVVA